MIATFIDITAGVNERLFTRIDVTEEWPFVADGPDGSAPPLGLESFEDNAILSEPFTDCHVTICATRPAHSAASSARMWHVLLNIALGHGTTSMA